MNWPPTGLNLRSLRVKNTWWKRRMRMFLWLSEKSLKKKRILFSELPGSMTVISGYSNLFRIPKLSLLLFWKQYFCHYLINVLIIAGRYSINKITRTTTTIKPRAFFQVNLFFFCSIRLKVLQCKYPQVVKCMNYYCTNKCILLS